MKRSILSSAKSSKRSSKRSSKLRSDRNLRAAALLTAAVAAAGSAANAASVTWSGSSVSNGNWSTGGNWSAGAAPGSTSVLTSSDITIFNAIIANTWGNSSINPLVIDSSTQNIGGINFDAAADSFFIGSTGGNSLLLSNGGSIQMLSTLTGTNVIETVNAPLVIEGAGGAYLFANNSASGSGAGSGTLVFGGAITGGTTGATVLSLAGSNTNANTISGAISNGSATTVALAKSGAGTWVLSGANTYTGSTSVTAGTLKLDFNAAGAPSSNIINSSSALALGGGTLQISGNSSSASSQTFNGVTLSAGPSVISAAPASGTTSIPTVTLGALPSASAGSTIMFVGPATINASGSIAATATITTTTAGTGLFGNMGAFGLGKNGAYATVGLYDYASTDTTAGGVGTSPYTIIGGSQVTGFYQSTGVTTTSAAYDAKPTGTNTFGNAAIAPAIRFNYAGTSVTINSTASTGNNLQGILVTPNVGAVNENFTGLGVQFMRQTSSGNSYGVIWQNNTLGYLNFASTFNIGGGRQTNQYNGLVQAGPGTVVYNGTSNGYELATYLNGGYSLIVGNGSLGSVSLGSTVNLNGGTVVGNATFTMDNAGANLRPFALGSNGGGLAATGTNILTIDGVVSGSGALTIGIPASSANSNTAGLLPGSGAGTANTTAVNATGIVVLSGSNTFSGATSIASGTLRLGSTNALQNSSVSFAGGNVQFGAGVGTFNIGSLTSTGNLALTDISSSPVTLSLGGNNSTATYAGVISGPGSLVKAGTGTLTLTGSNSYTGTTSLNGGTLSLGNSGALGGAGSITFGGGTLQYSSANTQDYSSLIVSSTSAISINSNGQSISFASALASSNTGGLTLLGSGTLQLSAANSYTGQTTLSAGTLIAANDSALGGSTLLFNGGTLVSDNNARSLSNNLGFPSASGGVGTIGGTNGITLSDTFSSNSNTLYIANSGSTVFSGPVNISTSSTTQTLTVNGGGNLAINGSIANGGTATSGNLTYSGSGVLTLGGSNTFGGTTTVSSGTVKVANTYGLQNSTVAISATNNAVAFGSGITAATFGGLSGVGSLPLVNADGNAVALTFGGNNTGTTSYSGLLSGSGSLTKAGTGTINLTGSNTYSGGTVISAGRIYLTDATSNQYALGPGTVTLNSGTLQLYSTGGSTTSAGNFNNTLQVNAGTAGTLVAWGRGELNSNLIGSGTFNYQTDYVRAEVNGNWSGFTGQINVTKNSNGGDFRINNTNGFGTAKLNLANGVLLYMNFNFPSTLTNTIGELTGGTSAGLSGGPTGGRTMTWDVGGANTDATYAGTITNGGGPTAITKSGSGTWTLSGSNSFSGATTISNGALQIGNANALVNTPITVGVNNGLKFGPGVGTFNINSINGSAALALSDTAGGAVTLSVGGTASSSSYAGNLSGAGGITKVGSGTLTLSGSNSYAGATAVNGGALTINGGAFSGNGNMTANGATINVTGATLSGTGAISVSSGALNLSGATLTGGGPISVTSGTLNFGGSTLGSAAVAVNAGGVLLGVGSIGGAVTVAGGTSQALQGSINLANGTLGTLSMGGLTVGDATAGAALLQFDASGDGSDLIALGANAFTVNPGGAAVKINDLGGMTPGQTFSLMTFTNGVAPTGITLDPSVQFGFNVGTLAISATALQLSITGNTVPTIAYFTGAYSTAWNGSSSGTNANFSTDSAGTINTNQLPGTVTDVYLGADGVSTVATTLGANFSVHSLNFVAGANASVSGSNTLRIGSGGITVNASCAGAAISNSSVVLSANQTWTNNSPVALSVSAAVSGSGSLTVAGGGLVALSGSNSYTGGTTLNSGLIQAGSNFSLGSGPLAINSGTLDLNGFSASVGALSGSAGAVITSNAGAGTLSAGDGSNTTYAGAISGPLGFTKTGAGSLVLASANTYTGSTTLNGGTLVIGASGAISSGTVTINSGGLLDLNGNSLSNPIAAVSGTIYNGNATAAAVSATISNSNRAFAAGGAGDIAFSTITGSAGLTMNKIGGDTVTLNGSSDNSNLAVNVNGGMVVLNHTSSSSSHALGGSGTSIISSGTLQLAGTGGDQISSSHSVAINGGVFDLNGRNEGIFALGGSGGVLTNSAVGTSGTLTMAGVGTYSGSIQDGAGTVALSVSSATAVLTLGGSNTFSGPTVLASGSLVLANENAAQNSVITPEQTGRQVYFDSSVASHNFNVAGLTNTVVGYINLNDDASNPVTLTVGGNNASSTYTGNLLGDGSLVKIGTGIFTLSGNNQYAGTTLVSTGTLAVTGSNTALSGYNVPGRVTVASGAGLTIKTGGSNWLPTDITTLASNVTFATGANLGIDTTAGSITIHPSNGVLTGSYLLKKLGSNSLQFTGSNSYSGGTLVSNGSIVLSSADGVYSGFLGSGTTTLTSGGSLTLSNATLGNISLDTPISIGSGVSTSIDLGQRSQLKSTITAASDSRLNLLLGTIDRDFVGGNWANFNGTLALNDAGSAVRGVQFGIQTYGFDPTSLVNTTLDIRNASVSVFVYTGGATVQVGALQGSASGYLGGANNTAGNGIVNWQVGAKNLDTTFAGSIIDGVQTTKLTKVGTGTLTLTGSNSFSSTTTISGGALQLGNANALVNTTVSGINNGLAFSPGVGAFNVGALSGSGAMVLSDTAGTAVTVSVGGNNADSTYSGILSGNGSLAKTGTGTLTLSGSNSHSGGTALNTGTLKIGNANGIGTGALTVNGGTLNLNGYNVVAADFSGSGGTITNTVSGTSTLTTTAASGTSTYAGNIANGVGAVALTNSGAGTLILSGSFTMAGFNANSGVTQLMQSGSIGATSVGAAGKLELTANGINSAKVLDTSSLSIAAGGTLDLWDNALILRDQTSGGNQGTNLSTVQGLVNTAFDNGNWDQSGITSSSVIADLGAYSVLTVMVYDNTILGVDSFEGVNNLLTDNGGNQVMLKTTYLGDFDGNGIVNSADYGWLDFYYGYGLTVGDLNGDGQVNSADYNGIDYGYGYQAYGVLATQQANGTQTSAAPASSGAVATSPEAVPEPGTLGLLLAGALGCLGFRRKAKHSSR